MSLKSRSLSCLTALCSSYENLKYWNVSDSENLGIA